MDEFGDRQTLAESQDQPFWMVYVGGRNASTKRHYAEDEARQEANRIARKETGATVWVLKAIGFYRAVELPTEWTGV